MAGFTRGKYSHAAIHVEDGFLFEALADGLSYKAIEEEYRSASGDGSMLRVWNVSAYSDCDVFRLPDEFRPAGQSDGDVTAALRKILDIRWGAEYSLLSRLSDASGSPIPFKALLRQALSLIQPVRSYLELPFMDAFCSELVCECMLGLGWQIWYVPERHPKETNPNNFGQSQRSRLVKVDCKISESEMRCERVTDHWRELASESNRRRAELLGPEKTRVHRNMFRLYTMVKAAAKMNAQMESDDGTRILADELATQLTRCRQEEIAEFLTTVARVSEHLQEDETARSLLKALTTRIEEHLATYEKERHLIWAREMAKRAEGHTGLQFMMKRVVEILEEEEEEMDPTERWLYRLVEQAKALERQREAELQAQLERLKPWWVRLHERNMIRLYRRSVGSVIRDSR